MTEFTVYVVTTTSPDGHVDVEVLDAVPEWDAESLRAAGVEPGTVQTIRVAEVNGGDSELVAEFRVGEVPA